MWLGAKAQLIPVKLAAKGFTKCKAPDRFLKNNSCNTRYLLGITGNKQKQAFWKLKRAQQRALYISKCLPFAEEKFHAVRRPPTILQQPAWCFTQSCNIVRNVRIFLTDMFYHFWIYLTTKFDTKCPGHK
jgi:hypothetical protein